MRPRPLRNARVAPAKGTTKAPTTSRLSRLNSMAFGLAAYVSRCWLPVTAQGSLPGAGQALLGGLSPAGLLQKVFNSLHVRCPPFPSFLAQSPLFFIRHVNENRVIARERDLQAFSGQPAHVQIERAWPVSVARQRHQNRGRGIRQGTREPFRMHGARHFVQPVVQIGQEQIGVAGPAIDGRAARGTTSSPPGCASRRSDSDSTSPSGFKMDVSSKVSGLGGQGVTPPKSASMRKEPVQPRRGDLASGTP